jgi:hypothetical protein
MKEPKPEWYEILKEESFQGQPFNMEKIRKAEQRAAKWTEDADNRKRKYKWKIAAFSLVICLGMLIFTVLFNRGGADWLKAKVQTTLELTQSPEPSVELVTLTESQDKRIEILGDLKSASNGIIEGITVRIDNKTRKFSWKSVTHPSFYPKVWLANVAGDDKQEVIINLTQAHETGMTYIRESEVHVLNLDFSEIKVTDPLVELTSLVQTKTENKAGKPIYSITVSGKEHLIESAETANAYISANFLLGKRMEYNVEDDALVAEVTAETELGEILGTVKVVYAWKDGTMQVSHVDWLGIAAEFTSSPDKIIYTAPIRAEGKTAFGNLQIVSKSAETIEALGTPSCMGNPEDFSIKGDYQVLFKNAQGKEFVVSENELKDIISPSKEMIPLNKLSFKAFESFFFTPVYTDCHGIQFYMYGINAEGAFQFKFQTDDSTNDFYYMGPNTKLEVIEDKLIVVGGRAAGDNGYALRYIFKPDLTTKTMKLVKTEKVVEK